MKNSAMKRPVLTLLCLLAVLLCLTVCAAAASGENLTFEIRREVDVWDEEMEWWDWDTEPCTVTVEPIADRIYNGTTAEPVPVIWLDGKQLKEDMDYSVSYRNNVNAGTAYVCVDFEDMFEGYLQIPFQILPADASAAVIDPIPDQPYDGWEAEPDITVRLNGVALDEWDAYRLEWSNNLYPGVATVTVRFFGNYTGEISASFSIVVPPVSGLSASSYGTRVYLEWNESEDVSSYLVQRYSEAKKKFVKINTLSYHACSDSDLEELTTYRYRVIPIVTADGKQWKGPAAEVRVLSGLKPIRPSLTKLNKKIKITWKPSAKADGYLIYRSVQEDPEDFFDTGPVKRIAKITDPAKKAYVDKKVQNDTGYTYAVRSYKKINGKTLISDDEWVYSLTSNAVLSGVKKDIQRSFPVYDTQGSKTKLSFQVNLTDRDIAILDKFAAKHFKNGWTDEQKLEYTMYWINGNVTYALGKQWTIIESKSFVEAIFKYKLGQCIQYNGAMAAMMVHLGYPARLIMGYRGSWPDSFTQHFWVESPINGSVFVVECGNAGRSGYWFYFFEPYKNTFGYIKNKKNVS